MERGSVIRLAGSEIHGFYTWEDLEVEKMMEEAASRWLRPNEIHAVLYNACLFTINVKPVHLPESGTVKLFDRKMLRNFRRDGHNWKKKNDGKTVKEAHEHLKVGSEERIHVYYAHGQDNPSFVRRCYWLLDKKYEHIVLVHYRETSEMQSSPVTPVTSNSGLYYSETHAAGVLVQETDSRANRAPSGNIIQHNEKMTVSNHEQRLQEINTLDWDDLLANDSNEKDNVSCAEQWNQNLTTALQSNSFPSNNISISPSSFGSSGYLQNMDTRTSNIQRQDFEPIKVNTNQFLNVVKDGLKTQDSFGRWMNHIMTNSPGSIDELLVESPISNGHGSGITGTTDHSQSPVQEQVFTINEVSPAWAFSTEETKVVVIGYFHGGPSHLADSNLLLVLGDECVPAEIIQHGVYRCKALPHTAGLVNLFLSFDGHTPVSQIVTFEYRSPSLLSKVNSPIDEPKWEEFQLQTRLAHLLFSATNSLNILSSKVSPNALKEAKKFALTASYIIKDWESLINRIGKSEISFSEAQKGLLEISLKNKLHEWLLERMIDGSKAIFRDQQGQGIIHLCSILGYTWAVRPYSRSGLSLDFRDAHGWTALHWAAYYGREEMVAVLLSAGANASLVTDPTPEFPGGYTCSDLASENGYDGLAAYLAEKGLTDHFRLMSISGNISGSLQTSSTDITNYANLNEEEVCQKESLAAYRTAAEAASRIQSAFRENSLKLRTKAIQQANPEMEARNIISAMRIQRAFRNYESRKKMAAAVRIQYTFRTWKIRKEFLYLRRQAIKIQAAFRGLQARKQYRKITWSVGILEKAIMRWRKKRRGLRGLQIAQIEVRVEVEKEENDVEEDFFKLSRKQAEDRVERSVVKVQALFRSHRAQQQYRRMKLAYDQAELEDLLDPDNAN